MTVELSGTECRIHQSRIRLTYTWWLGKILSRFYGEIRDHCKIWGIRCPQCGLVYVPPKENCPKCFVKMNEPVELSDTGLLVTYTIVRYAVPFIQPQEPPYALGIIKLDGADSGITHLLGDVDLNKIKVGMRMKAVFREVREGNLFDIKYFKPI